MRPGLRALALGICASPVAAIAQDSTTAPRDSARAAVLPVVEIAVTRDPGAATLTAPYAISVSRRNALDRRAQMQEVLAGIPGLFVANRNNPTQDPRIVIRGVGARTAFGVRGVRVLHDGIPLTVADGQTPVDYLDTESVGRIEVIRGSASSLYGNASGGVVAFSSPPLDGSSVEGEALAGSYGLRRSGARLTGGSATLRYSAGASQSYEAGFREHARQRVTRGTARVRQSFGASSVTAQLLAFAMPLAENPGALTAAQLATDRRMAEPLAVTREAGKQVRQVQAGLTYGRDLAGGDLSAVLFGGRRDLDNPLTFAEIELDRKSGGLLLRASRRGARSARFTVGLDAQSQHDDRREFENCRDAAASSARCPIVPAERGALRRSQRELVSSVGPYVSGEIVLARSYRLSAGVRADAITFDVRDRLVTPADPDESGRRTMRAVSPHAGVLVPIGSRGSLYANIASAFETPTATELGNKPDGTAGINTTLEPQRSRTLEAGAKGRFAGLEYDFAAFSTAVRDELVPFEIAGGAGRRFFRNAGRTRRRGAELSLATQAGPWELRSAATYSDFKFVEFETATANFSGKTIPGVPARFAELSATWTARAVEIGASGRFASSIFVDDSNTARAPGYEILNLRARGSIAAGRASLAPGLGVENLFGREYVGAVSVNAGGGRYFEPAPGRTVVASLAVLF
ncbi:MAG: TonB-dependent receptor [Gemmatimonadaceae bacterium]|nr:TonB-dependent receptor [Gemmatimonadaceae bacterium]